MKQAIILLMLCAISGCPATPASTPTFLEYRDSQGQYSFGYSAPGSARSEVRALDGSTRGSYSYIDDRGVIQSAQYTADRENGFRVVATNLPRAPSPVVDTPEVAAARLEHLRAVEAAKRLAAVVPEAANQREGKNDGRNVDAVVIDDAAATEIEGQAGNKSVAPETRPQPEGIRSAGIQGGISGGAREAAIVENEVAGASPNIENAAAGTRQIESQSRAAPQPDVPVVTTSFVIPGAVNLHNRIELVPSGAVRSSAHVPSPQPTAPQGQDSSGAARSSSESPASPQLSMPQGFELDASAMIPASSKIIGSSEKDAGASVQSARLPGAPTPEASKIYGPQLYSFAPGFTHANIIALPYAIGQSPIYPQYNYRFYPFGAL